LNGEGPINSFFSRDHGRLFAMRLTRHDRAADESGSFPHMPDALDDCVFGSSIFHIRRTCGVDFVPGEACARCGAGSRWRVFLGLRLAISEAPVPIGQEVQPAADGGSPPSSESLTIKCAAGLEILRPGGACSWAKSQRFGVYWSQAEPSMNTANIATRLGLRSAPFRYYQMRLACAMMCSKPCPRGRRMTSTLVIYFVLASVTIASDGARTNHWEFSLLRRMSSNIKRLGSVSGCG
jgi:hypothetical protein